MNARPQHWLLAAWSLILFAGCFTLHTRHQGFPFFRHPDEPGKAAQVIEGRWNFHHPMLLLTTAKVVVEICGVAKSEQAVVEAGRKVSAGFTALAVVALSLLAFLWCGWAGAVITGPVLALHHQLYELSHYMKEDTALLLGVALTLLAVAWFWRTPSRFSAALLGSACALAISGKYLGVMMLGVALPILWVARGGDRAWRIGSFSGALLLALAVVNLPLFTDLTTFHASFSREMNFVVHGQRGTTRSVPHAQYWSVFLDNTTPAIWLLLGTFLFARWRERKALTLAQWALIAFPFVYALALSFSPKSNDRYFLPATAIFTLLAVLGIKDAAHLLGARISRTAVSIAAALVLLALQVTGWSGSRPGLARYDRAFQHDDVQDLNMWVRTALPPDAVIAADNRAGLPNPRKKGRAGRATPIPQTVRGGRFANEIKDAENKTLIATLDELRASGVTHVAVSESDYGRFFLTSLRPQKAAEESFQQHRTFYETLFHEGELLWERDRGTVIYLHPGIRVYRIR